VTLAEEQAINVAPTVSPEGRIFAGTWGMVRSGGSSDRAAWNKYDGKVFAFQPDLSPAWPSPYPGRHLPYCYTYPGRPATPGLCPGGGTVSGYNGTVEGTAALNADGSVLYVGRGDGKLYALDADDGSERWVFTTFNPQARNDPDGGGEVVAGPLVGPDGTVYFATVAVGVHESNALYAVRPDGTLKWRYPHAKKSRDSTFWTAPALSPDGKRLYLGGGWGPTADRWDVRVPGAILAFDIAAQSGTGDQRLRWDYRPINQGEWWKPTVWTTSLAVGSDGTIYASGPEYTLSGGTAVAFAIKDRGSRAEPAWAKMVALDRGRAALSFGLALREVKGTTTRVYATSGNVYSQLRQGYARGGKLYALDARTGKQLWVFDPEKHGGAGSMTGIAVDAAGVVYTGVSGEKDKGRVFAIDAKGKLLWSFQAGGLLEWAHPVLGPEGNLYFADTRRCPFAWQPLESNACAAYDIDPAMYVIYR
jgi:outer membrane protein assembly factor BamB